MEGIKAFQGYMSPPMRKFKWLESFGLFKKINYTIPLVIFGCYKKQDRLLATSHKGEVIIVWMGTDSHKRQNEFKYLKSRNITHVTWLKPVQKYLKIAGIDCLLIKIPVKEYPRPKPVILGSKVYAYLAEGKPEYHGSKIVDSLNLDYPLLIGDNSINQSNWYNGESNKFYSQAFIGLALSNYVGGGMTILEMAVRGIRVVTNVMDLPNCIPWKDKEDVERIINNEAKRIGQSSNGMVKEVYNRLGIVRGCFDLEKLII